MSSYVHKIDRRTTLLWLGGAAGVAAVGTAVVLTRSTGKAPAGGKSKVVAKTAYPGGYGTDPKLIDAVAPWPRILTPEQLQTVALIADFFLPASATAPAASAVGVPDFIDEWVSAPYPDQLADRKVVLDGFAWLDKEARRTGRLPFLKLAPPARDTLLESAASGSAFLTRLRSLVIGAYYTTDEGFKDIGYIGNVALTAYPPASPEVKAHLAAAFEKLGL